MPRGHTVMIQGTTSDAGKSTLVTGLCRWARRRGVRVAPFKPQNMALNSAVTEDGGEIGRAQAVQAQACGLAPCSDMNPVLLKPDSDTGAQVIVNGRAAGRMDAAEYHAYKPFVRAAVLEAHARLAARYELVIAEGAGSPAEINLRDRDIANMGFAEAIDCPVVLVADIDRGGVFAHIIGTLALLGETERSRVAGFVINRFRGDRRLLDPGPIWLERQTGKPVLGVLPYLEGLHIDAEDALPRQVSAKERARLRVIVPALPRISNHTDFDPLRLHPGVDFRFVGPREAIPPADLVILPGSKAVRADLAWLRAHDWEAAIRRHLRYGGRVIGICGGFQVLGTAIHDACGVEGEAGSTPGLGLIDAETTLERAKTLRRVHGRLAFADTSIAGYEIHAGTTRGPALARPAVYVDGRPDGAYSEDGSILGTYVHGLFDQPAACNALLAWAGLDTGEAVDMERIREAGIERIADAIETHLDQTALERLLLPAARSPGGAAWR